MQIKSAIQTVVLPVILLISAVGAEAKELPLSPAFPGADGYGAFTQGGRGGRVIYVKNLNDSGPGSLREAVEATGPRIVMFEVSGNIELESDLVIRNSNITIAGQSAPGDGICLKNYGLMIEADQVVVRYLRVRRGRASDKADDALRISSATNVIVDHCSFSWGTDETVNTWHGARNITIQRCIISEALHHRNHGFAATLGGVNASYLYNLIANCPGRNPSIGGNHKYQTVNMDFRNSVIFNFGHRTFDGKPTSVNIVNNYFKPGPNSSKTGFAKIDDPGVYEAIPTTSWYVSGNVWEGNETISSNNAIGCTGATQWLAKEPNPFITLQSVSANEAYKMVIADVGANRPKQDPVDIRIIQEARTGKTTFGKGVVLDPAEVGGWPVLQSAPAPLDSDGDGMPETWEIKHGLNPNDPSDGKGHDIDSNYTNVEVYLNEL